jgi:anaphase-promoting complex subunit 4
MLVVQVERFSRVAATVLYLFQNFFSWVLKCVKILLSEPTDQVPAANSELVVLFLKFLLDKDPIKQLLDANQRFECDLDTVRHLEQLVVLGGFTDTHFLEKTLMKQFNELDERFQFTTLFFDYLRVIFYSFYIICYLETVESEF